MSAPPEIIFYDGHCGLCHGAVQFVLKRDPSGAAFRFAPLQGRTFEARVPAQRRAELPDTMVLQARDGSLLVRSDAWVQILKRLGGGWSKVGAILSVIPRPLRNLVYDFVALIRYQVFGRRDEVCPLMPPHLRGRFDP
jgi:predicted DCC family thiol-disulfide oxidoreductase YuxK